jgi:heme-degrading monooxygenase HmoA
LDAILQAAERKEARVHARVTTYEGQAGLSDEQVQEITRRTEETVLPTVRQMGGYKGVFSLMDRGTGKALSLTLWESEEAMRASEEAANQTRGQAAGIASQQVTGIERFEVTFWEVS